MKSAVANTNSNNLLHSQTIKGISTKIYKRNSKSVVTTYKWLNIVK